MKNNGRKSLAWKFGYQARIFGKSSQWAEDEYHYKRHKDEARAGWLSADKLFREKKDSLYQAMNDLRPE